MFHSGDGGNRDRLEHRHAVGRRSRDNSAGAEGRMNPLQTGSLASGQLLRRQKMRTYSPSRNGHLGEHRRVKRRGHPVMEGEGVGGDRELKVRRRRAGPTSGQAVRRRRGGGGGVRGAAGGDGGLPGGDEDPGGIDLEEEEDYGEDG